MKTLHIALTAAVLVTPASAEVLYMQPDGTATTADGQTPLSRQGRKASSLFDVRSISVGGGTCDAGVTEELRDHGFSVSNKKSADARLNVSVVLDGDDGTYRATLTGVDDHVLFSTSGEEGAGSLASLCEDIGDEIADALEDRMG